MNINKTMGHMLLHGIKWGALLGAVSGAIIGFPIFIIGALFGIFIGAFVGVFTGMTTGLIAGGITTLCFSSLKNILLYRLTLALVCAISATILTYLGSLYIADWLPQGTPYFYIPTVCAGIFAIPVSQNLVNWYINCKLSDH